MDTRNIERLRLTHGTSLVTNKMLGLSPVSVQRKCVDKFNSGENALQILRQFFSTDRGDHCNIYHDLSDISRPPSRFHGFLLNIRWFLNRKRKIEHVSVKRLVSSCMQRSVLSPVFDKSTQNKLSTYTGVLMNEESILLSAVTNDLFL